MNWQSLEKERDLHRIGDHTYNGKTIEEVEKTVSRFNMHEADKMQYLENCKRVIENLRSGYNLHENDFLRNRNFELVNYSLMN